MDLIVIYVWFQIEQIHSKIMLMISDQIKPKSNYHYHLKYYCELFFSVYFFYFLFVFYGIFRGRKNGGSMDLVHGPGPYFDGPAMDRVHGGVHGPWVHVLYSPSWCTCNKFLIVISMLFMLSTWHTWLNVIGIKSNSSELASGHRLLQMWCAGWLFGTRRAISEGL